MQKFILGREIAQEPRLLVAAHPTWGVDVGAAAVIRTALVDLRNRGAGVLIISEDLDELFEISDRIAVLNHGILSEPRITREVSVDEIGLLMGGLHDLPRIPAQTPAPTGPAAHV
jgi:simple sugar transport system ATP-binding protein